MKLTDRSQLSRACKHNSRTMDTNEDFRSSWEIAVDENEKRYNAQRRVQAGSGSRPAPGSGALNRGPQIHALKTWPAFYEAVAGGRKPFEARKADRDFEVGDTLRLEEWSPTTREYTGRACERLVTYIMRGPVFGVEAGWVVLGLALPNAKLTDAP